MSPWRASRISRLACIADVQWVYVLALIGDASDKVLRVSGVGAWGPVFLICNMALYRCSE